MGQGASPLNSVQEVQFMENLGKKVGYLKGLVEGMDMDTATANGKLTVGILDLLSDVCDRIENMDELLDDLNDYVESIDDGLTVLENLQDEDNEIDDSDIDFPFDDEDDDLDDTFTDVADQLHLLPNNVNHKSDDEDEDEDTSLCGCLCPECNRMFFTSIYDPEDAQYVCPHCAKQVTPAPLTPENAPIAHPVEE